jgi:hypothetical protein
MSRKACTFKQSDLSRVLAAAKKVDVEVTIRIGNMTIKTGECEEPQTNPWDGVLKNAEDAKRSS